MAYSVTREDILSVPAEAVVVCVDNPMVITGGEASQRILEAGGEILRKTVKEKKFLRVGDAVDITPCGLPYKRIILSAAPRWLTGKANELIALRTSYQSLFAVTEKLGIRTVAMPFLSVSYYRFPIPEAVHIALTEAEKNSGNTIFIAETEEVFAESRQEYKRPSIVSYVGWYRDDAYFALDNGKYVRVDKRPERIRADVIPYIEPCCREGNNPKQIPLSEDEIRRLRKICENNML
ncbi:MAG: macro domain-containing protein [Oscillospiraceae bacterium]|nr:macro domain-containing protein [Oscillospiraceae bacterium]